MPRVPAHFPERRPTLLQIAKEHLRAHPRNAAMTPELVRLIGQIKRGRR
jgi:hypothetical protein